MSKYGKVNMDPRRQHMILATMVEEKSPESILDVGCSNGEFSSFLGMEVGHCRVTGIDVDCYDIEEASKIIEAYCYNLEEYPLSKMCWIGDRKFDTIIFADVLEHLTHPDEILKDAANVLSDGGNILVSIPNFQYFKVRAKVAFGQMEYEDYGPLDKTHLRFFGYQSARSLVTKAGYDIVDIKFTVKPSNWMFGVLSKIFPGMFAYQFVFNLVKSSN